jgi:putative transposase
MLFAIGLRTVLRAVLFGPATIALENVALRHQLRVLQRSVRRPWLARWDRVFWVWLSRLWTRWRSSLVIVQPATVLAWHRKGFRLWLPALLALAVHSEPRGAAGACAEIRQLIHRMARESPT